MQLNMIFVWTIQLVFAKKLCYKMEKNYIVLYLWMGKNKCQVIWILTTNNLSIYQLLKDNLETERYVSISMSTKQRLAEAKLKMRRACIRLETWIHGILATEDRVCPLYKVRVETEIHVSTQCSALWTIKKCFI
jgi:hypothetical protein